MARMQVNAAQVPMLVCELCASGHATQDCQVGNTFGQQEQVNFANNFQHGQGNSYGNPYPYAYNPNWRTTHPNLSWGNNSNQQPQHPQQQSRNERQQKSGVEELLTKYIEGNKKRLESTDMFMKNESASIKNLEVQMGQIQTLLANRQQGALPSETEKNPREHVNAIALRSGTTYDEPRVKVVPNEVVKQKVVPDEKEKEMTEEEDARARKEKEKEKERARVDEGVKRYQEIYDRLPFPGRLKKQTDDNHYRKFLKMFCGLHI